LKNSPIPVFRHSTEKGRGSRRGDATTVGPLRGTEGSNPFLSSAESAANLTSSIRAPIEDPVSTPSQRFAHHPGGRPGGRVRLRAPSGIGSYKPSPAGTSTSARMAPSKCRRRTPNIGSVMAGPNSQDGRATKRLDPHMSAHRSGSVSVSTPTRDRGFESPFLLQRVRDEPSRADAATAASPRGRCIRPYCSSLAQG
jgi:hypothetical protein